MAKKKYVHVRLRREGWIVNREGQVRALSTHETQRSAIEEASKIARNDETQLIIHSQTGRVRRRIWYGTERPKPKPIVIFGPFVLPPKSRRDKIEAAIREVVSRRKTA